MSLSLGLCLRRKGLVAWVHFASKDRLMKITFLSLSLLFSLFASADVRIEEELYLPKQNPEVIKHLIRTGSVIVDHVTSQGFELYGSKGLSRHLDENGILYFDMKDLNQKLLSDYPTHAQMTERLKQIVAKHPSIMELMSIGKSVKGKDLWVVKISDNVKVDEVEPEFKYISSMHGDEITGRELTMELIEEMGEKYGRDPQITSLIDNTEIYIMPSMNPDGSELRQRANARGSDLNRNFPDITRDTQSSSRGRQIETQAVMNFQESRNFSFSANFHGGTIVMNYPWDSTYERHPLDALAQELALVYSELNHEMYSSREFEKGITNGADWYVVKGGMQDWSYFWFNDLQLTVELSHEKWPSYSEIPDFYRSNRDSMLAYMAEIHRGAGFKLEAENISGMVEVRQVSPVERNLGEFSFKNSEFYKVLPVGDYEFSVAEKRKSPRVIKLSVSKDQIKRNGNYQILR